MPTGEGESAGDRGAGDDPVEHRASLVNADTSREGSVRSSADAALVTPQSANYAIDSRQGSVQGEAAPPEARRRSSVVYPEDDDVNMPKVFARQSFIVSGEEEEMAETILKARQLAGERRRSVLKPEDTVGKQGEIAAVAQNLAHRRDSLEILEYPLAVAGPSVGTPLQVGVTTDSAEDHDAARRRSSVLNRIPDNLRALVQQSDASGVQQKMESPYSPRQDQVVVSKTDGRDDTDVTSSMTHLAGGHHKSWFQKIMASIQWKNLKPKRKQHTKESECKGRKDDNVTPATTPKPAISQETPPLLPKQLSIFAGRKKLILDLDETLAHSSFKPVVGADFILDIDVEGTHYKVFVRIRPGVDEFLQRMSRLYEVIIFTASLPQYANPLLDLLDPSGYITSRLFREHCTFHEGYFVKDLILLRHESLESTIIVDNSPMAYMFQPENAIDCMSWIDEKSDTELYVIADFLEAIVDVPDVRDLLEFWREGGNILSNE